MLMPGLTAPQPYLRHISNTSDKDMEGVVDEKHNSGDTNDHLNVNQISDFENDQFWTNLTAGINIFDLQTHDGNQWAEGLKRYHNRIQRVLCVLNQAHTVVSQVRELLDMKKYAVINGKRRAIQMGDILCPSELRTAQSLRGYIQSTMKIMMSELDNLRLLIQLRRHSCHGSGFQLHSGSTFKTRKLFVVVRTLQTSLETIFPSQMSQEPYQTNESEQNPSSINPPLRPITISTPSQNLVAISHPSSNASTPTSNSVPPAGW